MAVALSLTLVAGPLLAESVRVAATAVNVRQRPSTGTPVLATLKRGETLEVLERDGDWARVRTRAGVEGYVSARFLEPVAGAPASAPPATTPPASAPPVTKPPAVSAPAAPAPPAARVERLAIAHQDVGCVVAGAFPRLDACFTPAESVGRAQVLFRADENGPWYYVDMKPEGTCQSAVLPKPSKSISSFRYFIEAVDRSFTTVDKPEAAPGESYAPRVVGREVECKGSTMARSQRTASVLVGVARDSGGKVLQSAAAQTLPAGGSVAGFSKEGVTMVGTDPPPSTPSEAGKPAKAGGLGGKTLAIVGGVAAVGAVAAVAAGGGGDGSSSSGGNTGSGPSGGTPSGSTSLTGRWVGLAGNGDGLSLVISGGGISCTYTWDLTTDMVQTGSTFTLTGNSVARSIDCSIPLPQNATFGFVGTGGSGSASGTASGGSIATQVGIYNYSGTYTSTRIEMTSNQVLEGFNLRSTWRQTKQ